MRSVTELGYSLIDQNPEATTLTFRAPGPTPTWPGTEMTVAISDARGAARLVIGGNPFSGYERQAVAYRGARDIGIILLERLRVVLPSVAEPAPETVAAPPSRVDQLQSLADLRDRGALTDAEFDVEKKRLLD